MFNTIHVIKQFYIKNTIAIDILNVNIIFLSIKFNTYTLEQNRMTNSCLFFYSKHTISYNQL